MEKLLEVQNKKNTQNLIIVQNNAINIYVTPTKRLQRIQLENQTFSMWFQSCVNEKFGSWELAGVREHPLPADARKKGLESIQKHTGVSQAHACCTLVQAFIHSWAVWLQRALTRTLKDVSVSRKLI